MTLHGVHLGSGPWGSGTLANNGQLRQWPVKHSNTNLRLNGFLALSGGFGVLLAFFLVGSPTFQLAIKHAKPIALLLSIFCLFGFCFLLFCLLALLFVDHKLLITGLRY